MSIAQRLAVAVDGTGVVVMGALHLVLIKFQTMTAANYATAVTLHSVIWVSQPCHAPLACLLPQLLVIFIPACNVLSFIYILKRLRPSLPCRSSSSSYAR